MKKLLEAINRGILRGLNENTMELLSDLDDENLDLLDSILTKDVNNQYNALIHKLKIAILTGTINSNLKEIINNSNNFHKFKGIIKANGKDHLKELIKIGLKLFGNDGNFNWIDTSKITDMSELFMSNCFNGHIELWDVSNVTNMSYMFYNASMFNLPIGDWDVSNVTDMTEMFKYAVKFNLTIGGWDVSSVIDMYGMFQYATEFNLPIGDWDVSNVTDMAFMFLGAASFNQQIEDWDVSNVTNMYCMFQHATEFNLSITNWPIRDDCSTRYMFG